MNDQINHSIFNIILKYPEMIEFFYAPVVNESDYPMDEAGIKSLTGKLRRSLLGTFIAAHHKHLKETGKVNPEIMKVVDREMAVLRTSTYFFKLGGGGMLGQLWTTYLDAVSAYYINGEDKLDEPLNKLREVVSSSHSYNGSIYVALLLRAQLFHSAGAFLCIPEEKKIGAKMVCFADGKGGGVLRNMTFR